VRLVRGGRPLRSRDDHRGGPLTAGVAVTARLLDDARRSGSCIEARTVEIADLRTAYEIQHALTGLRTSRGPGRIGWKLGYTSSVMRDQLGISEPNHGPLLADMLLGDGAAVPSGVLQPRVEPEVALVLGRAPAPGSTVEEILDCCSAAHAALEVVDSVWCDYVFDLEHNTADGSSAAYVVLGPEIPLTDVADVVVELRVGATTAGRGHGRDAAGHPAAALAWLVTDLAARGTAVAPGDVVITGGLTAAVPLERGGSARAEFRAPSTALVTVSVSR
jgi:2-keto-4-pentenoate hydratase